MTESINSRARRLALADRLQAAVHDTDTLGAFAARAALAFGMAGLDDTARKLGDLRLRVLPPPDDRAAKFSILVAKLRRAAAHLWDEAGDGCASGSAALSFVEAVERSLFDAGEVAAAAAVADLARLERAAFQGDSFRRRRLLTGAERRKCDAAEVAALLGLVARGLATVDDADRLAELYGVAPVDVTITASAAAACRCDCVAPGQE